MNLTGSQILNAPVEKVWEMILNPEFLAKITPGITKLEQETDELYKAIAEIAIGPVKGKFTGQAELTDKVQNESFTLKVLQKSMVGNVNASIQMKMKDVGNNQTELSFDGKADISGLLARTGDRVMSGVANTLTKQFFSNFEKELSPLTPDGGILEG